MNDNDNEFLDELFSIPEKGFDKDDKDKLFEQYRIFLQMISSLERKREIVNRFYLSINIGLLAALGLSTQLEIASFVSSSLLTLVIPGTGTLFSLIWFQSIRSYKQLSTIKWSIVLKIERMLPLKIHETEWKMLSKGRGSKKYIRLTYVEQFTPVVFIATYVILIGVIVTT